MSKALSEMAPLISTASVVMASKDQVTANLAEEVVILDLGSGIYYGLDAVGAKIWSLIQEPRPVNDILESLLDEYEVEPERCEQDLLNLLSEMASRNLVEIKK